MPFFSHLLTNRKTTPHAFVLAFNLPGIPVTVQQRRNKGARIRTGSATRQTRNRPPRFYRPFSFSVSNLVFRSYLSVVACFLFVIYHFSLSLALQTALTSRQVTHFHVNTTDPGSRAGDGKQGINILFMTLTLDLAGLSIACHHFPIFNSVQKDVDMHIQPYLLFRHGASQGHPSNSWTGLLQAPTSTYPAQAMSPSPLTDPSCPLTTPTGPSHSFKNKTS